MRVGLATWRKTRISLRSSRLRARRLQARDQPVDVGDDRPPIGEPIARETHHEVGAADPPLGEADAGSRPRAVAGAANQEARSARIVDQVLALIRRARA